MVGEVVAVLEWEMCVGAVVFQSVWGGEVEQVEGVWERFWGDSPC